MGSMWVGEGEGEGGGGGGEESLREKGGEKGTILEDEALTLSNRSTPCS